MKQKERTNHSYLMMLGEIARFTNKQLSAIVRTEVEKAYRHGYEDGRRGAARLVDKALHRVFLPAPQEKRRA